MDCTHCKDNACRSLGDCRASLVARDEALRTYQDAEVQGVVQAAARLVDGGRAGTLSRVEEIAEYALDRGLKRLGLAYCYGMEKDAAVVAALLRRRGVRVSAVSCTTGALAQDQVNTDSSIRKVSCNPVGQAMQLNAEGVDLVVAVGLCLGHDMLLQQQSAAPVTTLVVKDRTAGHAPLDAVRRLAAQEL